MAMCKGFEHGGDPLEFFKSDTSAGAFGGCNDGLADHVVLMAAEASLPSPLTLEGLLGPLWSDWLPSRPLYYVCRAPWDRFGSSKALTFDGLACVTTRAKARGIHLR